jgi:hypothetical protein
MVLGYPSFLIQIERNIMFSFIKAFLTKTSNNNWCYSTQPRLVANGFLGSGGSVTTYSNENKGSTSTHYMWLPEGTDVDALSSSNPVIYLETKDGNPTGIYLSQGEYDAQSNAQSTQPVQQQAV